jgi:hypothetical protein
MSGSTINGEDEVELSKLHATENLLCKTPEAAVKVSANAIGRFVQVLSIKGECA